MPKASIYIALLMACHPAWSEVGFFRKDVPVNDRPLGVVVGDFNGDSRPDLAVNSFQGLSVLLNTGGGNFARPVTLPTEIHPMFGPTPTNYTVAADFNGDGRLDLAGTIDAVSPPSPSTRITRHLLGRGDGTFDIREVGPGTVVATGDFNRDRLADLVVILEESAVVLLGNGHGYIRRGARINGISAAVRGL